MIGDRYPKPPKPKDAPSDLSSYLIPPKEEIPSTGIFRLGDLILSWDSGILPNDRTLATLMQQKEDKVYILWSGEIDLDSK